MKNYTLNILDVNEILYNESSQILKDHGLKVTNGKDCIKGKFNTLMHNEALRAFINMHPLDRIKFLNEHGIIK